MSSLYTPTFHRWLGAASLALLLTACGGGGGGGDAGSGEQAPQAAGGGTDAGAGSGTGATGGAGGTGGTGSTGGGTGFGTGGGGAVATPQGLSTCGFSDFTAAALARMNQFRQNGASCGGVARAPTTALRWNDALGQAAGGHSIDMATRNYFSHTSLDGRSMSARVDATGYAGSNLGENIAAGQTSVNGVIDGWMASTGHCNNIMNPAFTEVGMACAKGVSGSNYSHYWTMNLARPR